VKSRELAELTCCACQGRDRYVLLVTESTDQLHECTLSAAAPLARRAERNTGRNPHVYFAIAGREAILVNSLVTKWGHFTVC